jgi:hypothetical protein
LTTETPQTPHPIDPVPTTGDGLLVRLSAETVAFVRAVREAALNTSSAHLAIALEALDAVQRDIDAAEAGRDELRARYYADDYDSPSDSTTRGGNRAAADNLARDDGGWN